MSGFRTYRVAGTGAKGGDEPDGYTIRVPRSIGRVLRGIDFEAVLTDDCLLFRPVDANRPPDNLPDWVKERGQP
mgnify:CR=1 FL=1